MGTRGNVKKGLTDQQVEELKKKFGLNLGTY
jgi:hypothetical protein